MRDIMKKYGFQNCHEVDLEYSKKKIMDKMNTFFGYNVVEKIKLTSFDNQKQTPFKKFEFKHGKKYLLPDNRIIIACYHPSPRNVNTGRINEKKMTNLFLKVLKLV